MLAELGCIDGEFRWVDGRRPLEAAAKDGPSCIDAVGFTVADGIVEPSLFAAEAEVMTHTLDGGVEVSISVIA